MMRPLNVTSVRGRLTLWSIGVLAVALIGSALTVHLTVRTFLLRSIDQDLAREAYAALVMNPIQTMAYKPLQGQHTPDVLKLPSPVDFKPLPVDSEWFKQIVVPKEMTASALSGSMIGGKQILPPKEFTNRLFFQESLHPQFSERHQFMIVRMRDLRGKVLLPSSSAGTLDQSTWDQQFALAGDRERTTSLAWHGQEWRVLTMPQIVDGRRVGVVQVAYPLQELKSLLRGVDQTLLTLIPLALLVMGCGGAFLTNRALRPVRQITMAALEVEARDLSRRLPVMGGDEFAELAITFNGMFGRLEAAFAQLEAAVEQQRRFTADASHELRTPLTTVRANADWALRKRRRVGEYQEALQSIVQAADRTDQIIESLLCLARSDSGHLSFEHRPILIQRLLQHTAAAIPHNVDSAPISLDFIDPTLCVVGSAEQLERVLMNLLQNALRHTPADGAIRLSAHKEGNKVVITVADTGEGIPAEHLPHVCKRFYRVDTARSRPEGGAGLGLAICESIIQAHGGTLQIESAPREGTRVQIEMQAVGSRQ